MPKKMIKKFTDKESKRAFNVEIVLHDTTEPKFLGKYGIHFYDATHAGNGKGDNWDEKGQPTGGHYALNTILGVDGHDKKPMELAETGLCLHGGVPEWNVSAHTMNRILIWALKLIS